MNKHLAIIALGLGISLGGATATWAQATGTSGDITGHDSSRAEFDKGRSGSNGMGNGYVAYTGTHSNMATPNTSGSNPNRDLRR